MLSRVRRGAGLTLLGGAGCVAECLIHLLHTPAIIAAGTACTGIVTAVVYPEPRLREDDVVGQRHQLPQHPCLRCVGIQNTRHAGLLCCR